MSLFPNTSFVETQRVNTWCENMKGIMSGLNKDDTVSFYWDGRTITGQIIEKINFYSVMVSEKGHKWQVGVDRLNIISKEMLQ